MADTITVEILFDDEVATGKDNPDERYFAAGDKVELPASIAENLIEVRKARKARAAAKKKPAASDEAAGEA